MAHFAELDQDNNVINIVVISNEDIDHLSFPESEPVGIVFCQSLWGADTLWKQTSYNSSFRRQYAGIGGLYYPALDVFVAAKPYPSWSLNEADATWQAPIPMPEVPNGYAAIWSEQFMEWDLVISGDSST